MHAILILQDVRRIGTVLPAAAWHDTIIRPVVSSIAIEQTDKLLFPLVPVDVFLPLRCTARIANTFPVKLERPMAMFFSVLTQRKRRAADWTSRSARNTGPAQATHLASSGSATMNSILCPSTMDANSINL